MNIFDKYLNLKCFLISFFIGMFMVYISIPLPEIIIKYPTPHNTGKIVYKDNSDMCYVYDAKQTKCPSDPSDIINTPLQITSNKDKNNQGVLSNIFDSLKIHKERFDIL